jgi:hypothetical protein
MPAPRSKPLLAWEPFPMIIVLVLLLLTGVIRPEGPPAVFWPFVVVVLVALGWFVMSLTRGNGTRNPDQWGDLSTLEGLDVIDVPRRERNVRAVVPVDDTNRHQPAIELARLNGGPEQHAVLVPRARRWLSRRYRIGVQLVDGGRPRHAGFLGRIAEGRWIERLDGMRVRGVFVQVPAIITGRSRPFGVELDLSGLEALDSGGADGS